DSLRRKMGDQQFLKLMSDFFAAHRTQTVTAQAFLDAASVKFALPEEMPGSMYVTSDIHSRLGSALLVYGTMADAGANRYAAEQMQRGFFRWLEHAVPIRKDFQVSEDELRTHDVIFVGRPETNSALARWQRKLGLDSSDGLFRIDGEPYASEANALILAAANPEDSSRMVLIVAGNSALQTVLSAKANLEDSRYTILESGKEVAAGFLDSVPQKR
ncbi:MAG TPA: hypothetical protein VFW44_10480, partial [Bryobacteraceae bacterium]|nr:hypothetical protein [Bryobacteraceae bacterium]